MRKIRYRRAVIVVPDAPPLTGICQCCGKKRKTDTHHYAYLYSTKQVRLNPKLALENTVELCFNPCHRVANAMKLLQETKFETRIRLTNLQKGNVGKAVAL